MKKILSIIAAVLLLACTFAACGTKEPAKKTDLEYVKEKGKLVIGITDYAPMNFKAEDGSWTGFDTEFAKAVCEKLGVEAEFIEIEWGRKYDELNSKAIDAIWNGMTITEEVKLNTDVSDAYAMNKQVIVMAKDKLAQYPDAESMKNLKFAAEDGSAGQSALADAGFTNVVAVAAQTDALLEVKSGAVDACAIDVTMADSMTAAGTSYENFGYKVVLTDEEYGIGFRKGSELKAEVNAIIAEMKADGSLQKIADKYPQVILTK